MSMKSVGFFLSYVTLLFCWQINTYLVTYPYLYIHFLHSQFVPWYICLITNGNCSKMICPRKLMAIVSQLSKCLKFVTFRGLFCIEYSHSYPPRIDLNFRHLLSCDTIVFFIEHNICQFSVFFVREFNSLLSVKYI